MATQKKPSSTAIEELKTFESPQRNSGFDPFEAFGSNEMFPFGQPQKTERKEPVRVVRSEMLFNRNESMETQRIRAELSQMVEAVKRELAALRVQDKALTEEISKLALQEIPEKPGVYHVRFFEFVIRMLQLLRKKISEGRLWLNATFEKKNKKKFWNMAKSKGTSFSRSNELTQANQPG